MGFYFKCYIFSDDMLPTILVWLSDSTISVNDNRVRGRVSSVGAVRIDVREVRPPPQLVLCRAAGCAVVAPATQPSPATATASADLTYCPVSGK